MKHCIIEGCERPHQARGYCKTHYSREHKKGLITKLPVLTTCTVEGCTKPFLAKGYCSKHYSRVKNGTPFEKEGFVYHGGYNDPEYNSYRAMKARCYSVNSTKYPSYGGRGIKVCQRWLGAEGYQNFIKDMGRRPTSRHSIERMNNDGNYEPSNCRWATPHEQAINKRSNTEHPGIIYNKPTDSWTATLIVNRKYVLHKRYKTLNEAINARELAKTKYLYS